MFTIERRLTKLKLSKPKTVHSNTHSLVCLALFHPWRLTLNFKKMKSIIISISALFLIVSCRPENIDIEVTPLNPKLVVFSHLIPDNAMIIAVTKSFSALESSDSLDIEDLLVSGAQVSVSTDEGKIDLFEFSPGLYTSLSTPNTPGKIYDLLVIKDSDTITATSTMLQRVNFSEITPVVTKGRRIQPFI